MRLIQLKASASEWKAKSEGSTCQHVKTLWRQVRKLVVWTQEDDEDIGKAELGPLARIGLAEELDEIWEEFRGSFVWNTSVVQMTIDTPITLQDTKAKVKAG